MTIVSCQFNKCAINSNGSTFTFVFFSFQSLRFTVYVCVLRMSRVVVVIKIVLGDAQDYCGITPGRAVIHIYFFLCMFSSSYLILDKC